MKLDSWRYSADNPPPQLEVLAYLSSIYRTDNLGGAVMMDVHALV